MRSAGQWTRFLQGAGLCRHNNLPEHCINCAADAAPATRRRSTAAEPDYFAELRRASPPPPITDKEFDALVRTSSAGNRTGAPSTVSPPDGYALALKARTSDPSLHVNSHGPVITKWPGPPSEMRGSTEPFELDGYKVALAARAQEGK